MSEAHRGWALPAPAKLNLFLHVLGRRHDGYHELQTVFQFLGHGDTLWFHRREDGAVLRRYRLQGVPAEDDLILRAARRLQQVSGTPFGVEIDLDKRLPMGGGLGGGSSDAATVLLGLNRLWGLGWSLQRLSELGLALGADVPVFIHGHAAFAQGVGERLTPVAPPERWYLVLVPPVRVDTRAVFQDEELTRDTPPIKISDFPRVETGNDCQAVVVRRHPEVGEALAWLEREVGQARMTGTGACVFAPFADATAARAVLARLPSGWSGFVARGYNRSPTHRRLEDDSWGVAKR